MRRGVLALCFMRCEELAREAFKVFFELSELGVRVTYEMPYEFIDALGVEFRCDL